MKFEVGDLVYSWGDTKTIGVLVGEVVVNFGNECRPVYWIRTGNDGKWERQITYIKVDNLGKHYE